jgi:hypothetical protein
VTKLLFPLARSIRRGLATVLWGRPYSRAVLWILAPVPLLTALSLKFPQTADILAPGWTLETAPAWAYILVYGIFLAEWALFFRWILELDRVLRYCQHDNRLRIHRDTPRKLLCPGRREYINLILDTKKRRRTKTALILAAAALGAVSVFISLVGISCLTATADLYPLLCLFLLLRLTVYCGTVLNVIHQAINRGCHWIGIVSCLPLFLLYLGMFAIDHAAVILTSSSFTTLAVLPFWVVQRRHGSGNPAPKWSVLWVMGSFLVAAAILIKWNWYDQLAFPNEREEDHISKPMQHLLLEAHGPQVSGYGLPTVFMNLGGVAAGPHCLLASC